MKRIYFALFVAFAFCLGNNLKATDYYLKNNGGAPTTATNWGPNTDGSGTSPSNFTGSHTWHFTNRSSASVVIATTYNSIPNTATIVIESGFNLTVSSNGTLGLGQINIASNGTLTLSRNLTTLNFNSLDAASTVVYNNVSLTVRAVTYGNLTISAAVSMDGSADATVNGLLTLNANLTLASTGAVLNLQGTSGTFSGSGSLVGNTSAVVVLSNGTAGDNGTLRFTSGNETLNFLQVGYSSASCYVTLGSNLTIANSGFFYQALGGVDLNGNRLTIDNTSDISFDGISPIKASGNSELDIEGTIAALASNIITMDATNNSIKSLTINCTSGSNDVLQLGNALTITDNIDVTAGTLTTGGFLTLQADATRSARLGPVGGTISGNITVQTYAPGGNTDWANLGVSGISGKTIADWETQVAMTCTGCIYDPSVVGGFVSIQGYDPVSQTYDDTYGPSKALTPGEGFWVYLGTGSSTTSAITWNFSGSPVTGDVPLTITGGGDGFNLLANPYASPISWDAVCTSNSFLFSPSIHAYNADIGDYTDYTAFGAASNPPPAGIGDVIPAGQGFLLDNSFEQATSITFHEADKTTANTTTGNPLTKGVAVAAKKPLQIVRLKLQGNVETSYTVFHMKEHTSLLYNGIGDARKIFESPGYIGTTGPYSKRTTISSKDPLGVDLSVNAFPPSSNRTNIPVLVRVSATGTYTMSAQDFENWPSCVIIKDKLTNTYHDLSKAGYIFTISDTTSAPRFELSVCETGASSVVSVKELNEDNKVLISQDRDGAFVKTFFEQDTKAVISVYNIIGQQLMPDVAVEGTAITTRLNLNLNEQVVIVKVKTDKEMITKKVLIH